MTDQVFLFASNPLKALELSFKRNKQDSGVVDSSQQRGLSPQAGPKLDLKQKQQSRSLSVCDEDTLSPKFISHHIAPNHSSNLNRTLSLAGERSSQMTLTSRRLLTIIPLFGCDIDSLEQLTRFGYILPPVIESAVNHILVHGIDSVGIFRKSGVKSRILSLRQRIETNQEAKFEEINHNNEFSIYDIADLVKMWFRELKPFPLLTRELIELISSSLSVEPSTASSDSSTVTSQSVATQSTSTPPALTKSSFYYSSRDLSSASWSFANNPSQLQRSSTLTNQRDSSALFKSSINQMKYRQVNFSCMTERINSITSSTHRVLLRRSMRFFARISSRCDHNQMTSQNLAICLSPSLCATESDQNSMQLAQKALECCIDNYDLLFRP